MSDQRANAVEAAKQGRLDLSLRAVALTEDGARVLAWLIFGPLRLETPPDLRPVPLDPLVLAAHGGRQHAGAELQARIRGIDPEAWEAVHRARREAPPFMEKTNG